MSALLPPVARFDSSSNVRIYRVSCRAFPGLVTHVYLLLGAGPVTLVDTGSGYGESTADLFAGYMMKSKAGITRLTVGVNNLLDQKPPLIYIGFAGDSDASTYDYMGRYIYARLSQAF